MSAPHADRDGSECWELEDGDTGEALLPEKCGLCGKTAIGYARVGAVRYCHADERSCYGRVTGSQPAVIEFVGAERQYVQATGLPEYVDGLKAQIVQLQLDLANAHIEHAQTLLDSAAEAESREWQVAYWEWGARFGRRKRIWRSGWDHWALKWFAGGDEYGRHTIVVGPWVIALWSCRCDDCKADEARLLAIVDADIDTDTTPEEEH